MSSAELFSLPLFSSSLPARGKAAIRGVSVPPSAGVGKRRRGGGSGGISGPGPSAAGSGPAAGLRTGPMAAGSRGGGRLATKRPGAGRVAGGGAERGRGWGRLLARFPLGGAGGGSAARGLAPSGAAAGHGGAMIRREGKESRALPRPAPPAAPGTAARRAQQVSAPPHRERAVPGQRPRLPRDGELWRGCPAACPPRDVGCVLIAAWLWGAAHPLRVGRPWARGSGEEGPTVSGACSYRCRDAQAVLWVWYAGPALPAPVSPTVRGSAMRAVLPAHLGLGGMVMPCSVCVPMWWPQFSTCFFRLC